MSAALVDLPVVIPNTVVGMTLLPVFGSQGNFGRLLVPLGLVFTDGSGEVVVRRLFVSLPYLVNLSREVFVLVDDELEQAALVEGASPWQAFTRVTLPLARRGVPAGC